MVRRLFNLESQFAQICIQSINPVFNVKLTHTYTQIRITFLSDCLCKFQRKSLVMICLLFSEN